MSQTRLLVLLVLALAVTAGAVLLTSQRTPRRQPEYGAPALPGLAVALDEVTSIRVVGAGKQTLVSLARDDGHWTVAEIGYPADAVRVRRLLVALGDLRVVEVKTADPARFAALAVEDVDDPKARSVRIDLGGARAPRALIVGHNAAGQGAYVRIPGQRAALEVRPALDVARTPRDWLARTIIDVAPARVESLEITRSDGPAWRAVKNARDAAHFEVPGLPKGRELASLGVADGAANALGNLEFDDVRRADAAPHGASTPQRTVVRCFDGLVVALEGRVEGDAHWLTVAPEFDPSLAARFAAPPSAGGEPVRAEAERLAASTRGWEYKVSAYRFDAIFRKRDEVLRH